MSDRYVRRPNLTTTVNGSVTGTLDVSDAYALSISTTTTMTSTSASVEVAVSSSDPFVTLFTGGAKVEILSSSANVLSPFGPFKYMQIRTTAPEAATVTWYVGQLIRI